MRRFLLFATLVFTAVLAVPLAGCAERSAVPDTGLLSADSLAASLLASGQLPGDFVPVQADLNEFILANRELYERAAASGFDPGECRPTADAEFNARITASDTALLAARAGDKVLTELLSTVPRDVEAFRRSVTGPCVRVTVTPEAGSAGARSTVTTSRVLTESRLGDDAAVEQAVVVGQESVTQYSDGGRRSRLQLAAALRVRRPGGDVVTLQLNSSGPQSTGDGAATAPMTDREFLDLVVDAVERAKG